MKNFHAQANKGLDPELEKKKLRQHKKVHAFLLVMNATIRFSPHMTPPLCHLERTDLCGYCGRDRRDLQVEQIGGAARASGYLRGATRAAALQMMSCGRHWVPTP